MKEKDTATLTICTCENCGTVINNPTKYDLCNHARDCRAGEDVKSEEEILTGYPGDEVEPIEMRQNLYSKLKPGVKFKLMDNQEVRTLYWGAYDPGSVYTVDVVKEWYVWTKENPKWVINNIHIGEIITG